MRTIRTQKGYPYKKAGWWYVRVRLEEIQPDGEVKRVQRSFRLVSVGPDYRSKRDVETLRKEKLEELRLNSTRYNVQSSMTLSQFVDGHYLPSYVANLKPSVRAPHKYNWKKHLEPLCGHIRLRDFRTVDGQRVIDRLVDKSFGRNSVKRLKSLLSGVFSEAMRQGVLDEGKNPMREVRIPTWKTPAPRQRHAYSLTEVNALLQALPEPARTVATVCAFAGLRAGEVEALRWEHYRDGALWIEQSHWRGHFTDAKTEKSMAPVPVIAPLRGILNALRNGTNEGLVFRSAVGTPLNLQNLAKRVARPAVEGCVTCRKLEHDHQRANHRFRRNEGLPRWHGWHAFRHGLSTNLKQLGVDDKTIQAILRHADQQTTVNTYIHAVPEAVREAMQRLEEQLCTLCAPNEAVTVN